MRLHQGISARVGKGIAAALLLVAVIVLMAMVGTSRDAAAAVQVEAKLQSTIFSYDGKDFVRTQTTMLTAEGRSAVNTRLDHESPAYKALVKKHSYVGDATIFGHKYAAEYAPLLSDDGRLTGALFVGVAR
jgi:hypothetical protein